MKSLSNRLFVSLATLGLGLAPAACGEKPSFQETEQTVDRRTVPGSITAAASADATRASASSGVNSGIPGEADSSGDGVESNTATNDAGSGSASVDKNIPDGPNHNDGGSGSVATTDGSGSASGSGSVSGSDSTPDANGADEGGVHLPTKTMTRSMSFPADTQQTAEVNKTLDDAYSSQTLALKRNYYDHAKSLKQITRPVAVDNFTQGTSGDTVNEAFDQVAGRLLDILVVVDDSGSMKEEQANLATKLAPLLSSVKDADWQIGVTTTDTDESCLRALIKKSDVNGPQAFMKAVNAGIAGSGNERPLLAAVQSLRGDCVAQPWIRPDSNVAVLIVSDEDNCSYRGEDCGTNAWAKANYLVDYLASIRQIGKTAKVHGIIWHPSQTRAQCPTGYVDDQNRDHRAYITADVIAQTSGTWGSICDADYTATLNNVSKDIRVTLNTKFMLQQVPDLGTLHVFVAGTEVTSGFTVTGRLLEFATAPADGAKITATYHHGSTPVSKSFALRFKPLADKLSVTVNGQLAQPADYLVNLSGAVPSVGFYTYPVDRAAIAVSYTRDVALNTQFALGEPVSAGSLNVRVNGVDSTDFTLQESTGVVTFGTAPSDSATIEFAYTAVGAAVLSYPFTVNGAAPVDLTVLDANTAVAIKFSYVGGAVVLNASDFVEGRLITFKYDNVARQHFTVMLPNEPVLSTLSATGGTKLCVAPAVSVSGTTVAVDGCGFADDVASVSIRYNFVTSRTQTFTFAADKLPAPTAYRSWTVLVNDKPAAGFTRVGNVVTFDTPLPIGAIVKIQLIQEDK